MAKPYRTFLLLHVILEIAKDAVRGTTSCRKANFKFRTIVQSALVPSKVKYHPNASRIREGKQLLSANISDDTKARLMDFKVSRGWSKRFAARYNITSKALCG